MKRLFCILLFGGLLTVIAISAFSFRGNPLSAPSPTGLEISEYLLKSGKSVPELIDILEQLEVTSVKLLIPWQKIEPSSGLFSWTLTINETRIDLQYLIDELDNKGIDTVVILDGFPTYLQYESLSEQQVVSSYLESWDRYVHAVVAQFGDQVGAWQVGTRINMPFHIEGQPIASAILSSPTVFAERLKLVSEVLTDKNSQDLLIAGGIVSDSGNCLNQPGNFLTSLNELGVWDMFDVIGIDLITYNTAPEGKIMYQIYDSISGTCLTSAEGGFSLSEIIALVDGVNSQYGKKQIWISNLGWSENDLSGIAAERGTLPDLVRSDFMARTSISLFGDEQVGKIFWTYPGTSEELNTTFGVFTQQVFHNLSTTLSGMMESSNLSDIWSGTYQYRITTPNMIRIFLWNGFGGDAFTPFTIQDVSGYALKAYSLDTLSLNSRDGIELPVDDSSQSALMLSERPVLVNAQPKDLKERISLGLRSILARLKGSFNRTAQNLIDTGKEKASEQVEEWVDEQKESLFSILKESITEWLNDAINLDRLQD